MIDDYYSSRAHYSFRNGCSTGGRQGLMEAQRYPADFNGILDGAPALNWDQFRAAQLWPQLVMEWNNDYLPACLENLVNTTLQLHRKDQDGPGRRRVRPAHLQRARRAAQPDRHRHARTT